MKHKYKKQLLLFIALLIFMSFRTLYLMANNPETNKITLQLKWKHQFQFAGYYAAVEKGFYAEKGLEVNLIEAEEGQNPIDAVVKGRADFGIATSDIALYRAAGAPLIVLATIYQHSPQVLLASKSAGINHIHNLIGKTIALEPNAADIIAFMKDEGILLEDCNIIRHAFDVTDLVEGKVDAISAYATDEPFLLNKLNFAFTTIDPKMGGIDFYGDLLFTSEQMIRQNPQLVEDFRAATLKGWEYALNNKDEIIRIIYNRYSKRHSIEHLTFEAEHTEKFILPAVVELGYTNPNRWQSIIMIYQSLGMIDADFKADDLLYQDNKNKPKPINWTILFIYLAVLVFVGSLSYYFYANARKFQRELKRRQAVEKTLQESEHKYRLIVETASEGILSLNNNGILIFVNKRMAQMLGYETHELLGKEFESFLAEDQLADHRQQMVERMKGHDAVYERCFIRKDGKRHWMLISASANKDQHQKVVGSFAMLTDINDRKKAEDSLKANEVRYRLLTENMKDVVWTLDTKTLRFTYVSPSVKRLRGYTAEEIMAQPFHAALSPKDAAILTKDMNVQVEVFLTSGSNKKQYYTNEVDQPCKDGSVVSTEVITSYHFNHATNSVELHGVTRDITDRKKIESALRESEEKFREMAEMLPQIIFELDHEGRVTYINQQACQMLGYCDKAELIGFESNHFHVPQERERVVKSIAESFTGIRNNNREYTMLRKDGSTFPALIYTNPVMKDNKIVGLRGLVVDITDRKQLEEAITAKNQSLHILNAEKDKFFSIIAHDLKSPFNSIVGFSEILKESVEEKDTENIEKYAEIILQSSHRAMNLLLNLMEWSRSQTGRMKFNPMMFDLTELVEEIILLLQANASQKSISLNIDLPAGNTVFADKAMIATVVRNLLSNAIKFTKPGGSIKITAENTTDQCLFSVHDNGIGIPKERIKKLFSIAEAQSTVGTLNEKGTGLGLILCKEFIDQHKGKIWIESAFEQGSSFYFTIPTSQL